MIKHLRSERRLFRSRKVGPVFLTVITSIGVFVTIHILGFWDVEDLFVSGSSVGARFGFSGVADQTNDLVYSLWGVPLLDFGIIGGYRLPYQGTVNTGPFWIFRNLLPAEIILGLTLLASMVLAATAFGRFWLCATRHSSNNRVLSDVLCFLCWLALYFPTFEYLLQQDWYTMAIVNQGFVAAVSSLLNMGLLFERNVMNVNRFRPNICHFLGGSYFLVLGHTGLLAIYGPTLFVLAALLVWKNRKSSLWNELRWRMYIAELLLLSVVITRTLTMVAELLPELLERRAIGTDSWWARPTRSLSDLKHFLGQLLGTEVKPWFGIWSSEALQKFNISKFSRTPHTSALVVATLIVYLVRNRQFSKQYLSLVVLGLWVVNFLMMVRILPNVARVPVDYLYRDVLLTLGMTAVCLAMSTQKLQQGTPRDSRFVAWILVVVLFTSFSVALSNPLNQFRSWSASPFAITNSLHQSTEWIGALQIDQDDRRKVLVVIDPTFLSRWQDEENKGLGWKGLRGFFQLRQAGIKTVEGSPKIRDATAFTGATTSLKQSLDAPNSAFCKPALFRFLGVSKIIMSSDEKDTCTELLGMRSYEHSVSAEITAPVRLPDSSLWMSDFAFDKVFTTASKEPSGVVKCGILADSECVQTLQLAPSTEWRWTNEHCRMPCVLRLVRSGSVVTERYPLILPLNEGNSLHVIDELNRPRLTQSVNGLLTIPQSELNASELKIVVRPDLRMWLQVFLAYSQFVFLLFALLSVFRKSSVIGSET